MTHLYAHSNPVTVGRTLTLAGPSAYTVQEVIALCEKYADADANVQEVPVWLLKLTRNVLKSFQWARDASDRLVREMKLIRLVYNNTSIYRVQEMCEVVARQPCNTCVTGVCGCVGDERGVYGRHGGDLQAAGRQPVGHHHP